jgi:regulator of protease activity HflC (stomatin/prohibitin superfamily)
MASKFGESQPVDPVKTVVKTVLTGIVVLVLVIAAFSAFYTIESGQEGVLLTFGQAGQIPSTPGLHFKLPFVQRVVKFDMRTQALGQASLQGGEVGGGSLESASSKDLQIVSVKLVVNYRLDTGKSAEIFSNIGPGYEDTVIAPAVHEATKAAIAQFNAQELITQREKVRSDIQNLLQERMRQFNINVQSVSITAFDFSGEFNRAIEQKQVSEQNAFKATNDLKRIQIEATQVAAAAQGQRDAAIAVAEGQANATILTATAEARKVQMINEQLRQSPQYIEYVKATRWDGRVSMVTGSQGAIPVIDVNSIFAVRANATA